MCFIVFVLHVEGYRFLNRHGGLIWLGANGESRSGLVRIRLPFDYLAVGDIVRTKEGYVYELL